jgi:hypothetical protein
MIIGGDKFADSGRRFAVTPRLALFALIMAFGVSVAFATVTTVRQVHLANSSSASHAAHS